MHRLHLKYPSPKEQLKIIIQIHNHSQPLHVQGKHNVEETMALQDLRACFEHLGYKHSVEKKC